MRLSRNEEIKAPAMLAFAVLMCVPLFGMARDLGALYGDPTPALAMYVAQVNSGMRHCASVAQISDEKDAERYLKQFNNAIQLRKYQAEDPDFARNLETFIAQYNIAWNASLQDDRQRFCKELNTDVAEKKSQGLFRWAAAVNYFRLTFSPVSVEAANRRRAMAGLVSVAGNAMSTAASVSAGNDSVASARAGKWDVSAEQMATAEELNAVGMAFSQAGRSESETKAPVRSVADRNGTVERCATVDHFFRYEAPMDSPIWMTYRPISSLCRDPSVSEADLLR